MISPQDIPFRIREEWVCFWYPTHHLHRSIESHANIDLFIIHKNSVRHSFIDGYGFEL